jgi:hypothetical protein
VCTSPPALSSEDFSRVKYPKILFSDTEFIGTLIHANLRSSNQRGLAKISVPNPSSGGCGISAPARSAIIHRQNPTLVWLLIRELGLDLRELCAERFRSIRLRRKSLAASRQEQLK